jgi:hypothetical protein
LKRAPLNRTLAKHRPECVFKSPLDIVDERLLTRGEKLGTLDRWRKKVLQGEGLDISSSRAGLLGQIEEAKGRLGT